MSQGKFGGEIGEGWGLSPGQAASALPLSSVATPMTALCTELEIWSLWQHTGRSNQCKVCAQFLDLPAVGRMCESSVNCLHFIVSCWIHTGLDGYEKVPGCVGEDDVMKISKQLWCSALFIVVLPKPKTNKPHHQNNVVSWAVDELSLE